MAHLGLGVLGSLQVMAGGRPLTALESDKARALLIYLAVESRQPHRREALAALLWPDCPDEMARRNFRQQLYLLRQAIADAGAYPPYLLITRSEIQFNTASDHFLDLAAFEDGLKALAAHPHPDPEEDGHGARRLKQAVDVYRGKFLSDFFLSDSAEFEEWALLHRESLHRRALEALERLADYHDRRGEHELARGYAFRQLELEPWWEPAHRQMMRALAASGNRSAALSQYEHCRRVLNKELGAEPSAETRDLYERIKRGEPGAGTSQQGSVTLSAWTPPRLPTPMTSFVGRERELQQLEQLLTDPACRLLTLLGPGGIGKTRLALKAAAGMAHHFAHGAAFVSLAGIDSAALLPSTVANSLGLVFSGPLGSTAQLLNHLRDKQMLLLLDNLEQVRGAGSFLVQMLEQAPGLRVLATSREPLKLSGEWLLEVGGLELPAGESGADFEQSSAVALFWQRARRAQVGFAWKEQERQAAAQISRLVGGMPLAIELAAGWVRTLSVEEIAAEIERGSDLLVTDFHDLPERHRSMRAVFDHSWRSLSAEEQLALARLSILRGSFQREAAEQVADASLSILASLVSKSLVRRAEGDRYELHELVRQYAADRLRENPAEQEATARRHGEYYLDLVAAHESHLCSQYQKDALAALELELANVRQAFEWALASRDLARLRVVSFPLLYFYELSAVFQEGADEFGRAADRLQGSQESGSQAGPALELVWLQMRINQGYFLVRAGRVAEGRTMLVACTDRLQSLGDKGVLGSSLRYLGRALTDMGNLDEAEACLRQSLELSAAADRAWDIGSTNGFLGAVALWKADLDGAHRCLHEALAIGRRLGDPRMITYSLNGLGAVLLSLDRPRQAQDALEQALTLGEQTGDRYAVAITLRHLGGVVARLGDTARARTLLEQSLALLTEVGDRVNCAGAYFRLGQLDLLAGHACEAGSSFRTAARLAAQTGQLIGLIDALAGLASVEAKTGSAERALELAAQIREHPAASAEANSRAEALVLELSAGMAPEQFKAIELRARTTSLDALALELGG